MIIEDKLGTPIQVGAKVVVAVVSFKTARLKTGVVKSVDTNQVVVTTDRGSFDAQAGTSKKSVRNCVCDQVVVIN